MTYLKNQTDNCTVTIDNVDRGFSSYFAYNEFSGQDAEIWKIFLDSSLNPIGTFAAGDYIVQFQGMMDRPKVSEDSCEVRIVNVFNREQSYSPWRRFSAKCNWRFCGTECGYNGGVQPRGTANSGSTTTLTDTVLVGISSMIGGSLKVLDDTTNPANKNEVRKISDHNTGAGQVTFESAFPAAINSTTKYIVECDKSKSTCKGYAATGSWSGNEGWFGGAVAAFVRNFIVNWSQVGTASVVADTSGTKQPDNIKRFNLSEGFTPIIYGIGAVPGEWIERETINTGSEGGVWRYYAICEGEIDSIQDVRINGISRTLYATWPGGTSQVITFAGSSDKVYYRRTAVAQIGPHKYGDVWSQEGDGDTAVFTVKGTKVQKYLANGTTDGSPVWSQNPIWGLIDFLLNRASKKLDISYINFAYAKAAADLCDTLNYKINLVIREQKKDTEIIELMLAACRGYITYSAGKMEINLERAWVHPTLLDSTPAHYFDDASSGKTQDNISEGSFNYWQEDVNDTPNKFVVKYIDQEVRENMALLNGLLPAANATIPYSDLKGSFAASGTIYIGAEAITYTGNNGAQLTGCSARTKDYPSGYVIFQGAQTFPELTAIYNDYDNQDKVKRVIEKEIDGSAIPTYKQAYNIAEYHGRKAVEGNLKCSFKGLMDSLKLTVGDVVKVTHALPGWVDEEFRVTEASESEDEEVDYTLELYDDSFYAESDGLPGAILATTLPNPFAVPGHVTNLSLSEDGYTNSTGQYIPTLTLTYSLPAGDSSLFWDRARVQISTNDGATYPVELTDTTRGTGFKIDGWTGRFWVGNTVKVRVISVSAHKISADAVSAPTISNKIDGLLGFSDAPRGLSLEGKPNETVWEGLRFALTWWKVSQTGGAGKQERGYDAAGAPKLKNDLGAGGYEDPYWQGDEYELWAGAECIDSGITKEARYDYIYGDGFLDHLDAKIAATNGTVTFKVRHLYHNNPSEWTTITIIQAAPANPTGLTGEGLSRSVLFTWEMNVEADLDYYSIRTKIGVGGPWSGWSDVAGNSYLRTFTVAELTGGSLVVYIEVKAVDLYGKVSGAASTNAATWMIIPDELYTSLRTDFWVRDSIFYFNAATLTWTTGSITRDTETFTLSASTLASANNKYVIATLSGGAATLSLADMTAGIPALNANQIIIATTSYAPNSAGNYLCFIRQANSMMIEGAIIRDATILNAKIVSLDADKITASTVLSNTVIVSGRPLSAINTDAANGATFTSDNAGDLAYKDQASATDLDTTIISGGKIVTGLLTADNIQAGTITADRIISGSISVPVSAYTPGAITCNQSAETLIQQASITSVGSPIQISISSIIIPRDSSNYFEIRVYRGATEIYGGVAIYPGGSSTSIGQSFSTTISDTPGSGSFTYYVKLYNWGTTTYLWARNTSLTLLENRK